MSDSHGIGFGGGDASGEVWVLMPGTGGLYSVSSHGRVRSEPLPDGRRRGGPRRGGVLRLGRDDRGYVRFSVRSPGERRRTIHVHRAVAEAFLGPRPVGHVVNHKNGVKTDNRADNLEYVTPLGNSRHAAERGLYRPRHGSGHYRAKLTEADVRAIRACGGGRTLGELAAEYGVAKTTICRVLKRRGWSHVCEE